MVGWTNIAFELEIESPKSLPGSCVALNSSTENDEVLMRPRGELRTYMPQIILAPEQYGTLAAWHVSACS